LKIEICEWSGTTMWQFSEKNDLKNVKYALSSEYIKMLESPLPIEFECVVMSKRRIQIS